MSIIRYTDPDKATPEDISRLRAYEMNASRRYFALADCNNFFVSCERLFRPDLKNRPVIVLSNNDGCVISRSNESKKLGIPMGIPLFKIKHLVSRYGIAVFSSNFSLYLDISNRVFSKLCEYAVNIERYSIDESFIDLTGLGKTLNIHDHCMDIRHAVTHDVGIPICVGGASTKTLAKIANHCAKKGLLPGGVMTIDTDDERLFALKQTPLDDIWGIGRALNEKFSRNYGIKTAYDLSLLDPEKVKKRFSVTVANIIRELNGISCLTLEDEPRPKKQIMWSRTFGHHIMDLSELRQIVADFIARAAEKLREDGQYAGLISIFIQTNLASRFDRKYAKQANARLSIKTCDTTELMSAGIRVLERIFVPGYLYYKAGVILEDLSPVRESQSDMFDTPCESEELRQKREKLQSAVDILNRKKRNSVFLAAQGIYAHSQVSKQEQRSPSYTTSWEDLPKVK